MPFTIRQLECLLAVAETGSITSAAAVLHASDSAVSDSVIALERALGATLFHRRRARGASLTSDGLTVVPIARRILADSAELGAVVNASASTIVGPVRIGSVPTLASVILPSLFASAAARHPAAKLVLTIGDQRDLLRALDAEELDLVLGFDVDVSPEYERQALDSTQACVALSAEHRLARRKRVRLEELAEEPFILLDSEASRAHTLELMSSRQITPRIVLRTDDYELCRAMVGRQVGYSLLMNRRLDRQTWDGGRTVFVPIDPPPRRVDALLVWLRGPRPARVSAIVELAVEVSRDVDAFGNASRRRAPRAD